MVAHLEGAPAAVRPVTVSKGQPATFQTRISSFAGVDPASGEELLSAYAALYCRIQRRLFADVSAGRSAVSLKADYLRRYRIPARLFNALRVSLEGKIASVREQSSSCCGEMTCSGG